MKKIIAAVAVLLLTATALLAQSSKSIYKKYSNEKGVSAVYISPAMFSLIRHIPSVEMNDEDVDLSPVISSLTGMYILSCENRMVADRLLNDVERLLDSGDFELLMEAKEDGDLTRMFSLGDETTINSFVLLNIEPDEVNFIAFEGKIPRKAMEDIVAGSLQEENDD